MLASYHKNFKKSYKKLSVKVIQKVNERILLFLEDPFNSQLNNHSLSGKYNGYRSINISGDLRAIYKLLNINLAHFIKIDTHSNLYK